MGNRKKVGIAGKMDTASHMKGNKKNMKGDKKKQEESRTPWKETQHPK